MDLQISTESFDTADWTWLASKFGVDTAKPVTLLLSAATKATHYPSGRIKPGTLLAKFTSGTNAGLWAPYVHDNADGEGLATAAGIALDGFTVRIGSDGSELSTVTVGACLLAGTPIQVNLAKLPGLLEDDGTTAHAPVLADLPTGMISVDLS